MNEYIILYIILFSGNIKYSEEIIINANIDTVKVLIENPYNMKKYMEGIESYKILSGKINNVGTKAEITFLMGEKKILMIEEIIINNLPIEKIVTYKANGINNIVTNKLVKISEYQTKLINEQEFEFDGGYMKIFGFFMSSAFKEQSRVYLKNFKQFVEIR